MRYTVFTTRKLIRSGRPFTGSLRWGVFLLVFFLAALATSASAMRFNANWDYSQSGGEDSETQKEFRQRYSLGAGSTLSAQPSHALSASAGVGYTRTQGEDSQGSTRRDKLTPYGQLSLVNDIFTAQLSGTTDISTPDDHTDSSATSWNGTLGSTWDIPLFPHVRFNFGETSIEDENGKFPTQTVKNKGLSLDWDLLLAQINYQYNTSETTTEGSDGRLESDSHFVRLETGGNLWNNRVNFHLTQNFNKSTQEVYGVMPLRPVSVLGGKTNLSEPLQSEGWAIDSINFTNVSKEAPLEINAKERIHVQINSQNYRKPDFIRIVFDEMTTLTKENAEEDLEWGIFIKKGSDWILQGHVFGTYSIADKYIDIRFEDITQAPLLSQDIMISTANPFAEILTVNSLEIHFLPVDGGLNSSSTTSTTSSYVTNFNLGYRITPDLIASGGVILNHSEFNDGAQENDRRTLSGTLRYIAHPAIIPSIGYNEGRNSQTGSEESLNRSYNFTLATIPLPTVSVAFGTTYGEQFLGSQKTNVTTRYTLSSRAAIYPDLSAAGLLSYGESESRGPEGNWSDSNVLSGRLNLNARLRRNVNADMTATYFKNDTIDRSLQGGEVTAGLRYRPSAVLSLRGAYSTFYGDETREDSMSLGATWSILTTHKARLTFNATHYQEEETRETFALLGSWNISRSLSFWTRANYLIADENVYNFQVNLALGI